MTTFAEPETACERGSNQLADMISFEEAFPLTGRVFAGPPGRSYWVLRRLGVNDALSPPVGDPRNARVTRYDLFSSRDYSYIGTVRAPDGLSFRAGDGNRIAGVFTDELGVETVRVMRLLDDSETTQP